MGGWREMNWLVSLSDEPIVDSIAGALLHFLWQGTAIAILLALALHRLRFCKANSRYVAACFALLLMKIAQVATFVSLYSAPVYSEAAIVSLTASSSSEEPPALAVAESVAESSGASSFTNVANPSYPSVAQLSPALGVGVWLVGVVGLSFRLLRGWFQVRRICRIGVTAPNNDIIACARTVAERLGLRQLFVPVISECITVPM